MTFRTRIVLAATVTAVFAVLVASLGAYVATRNSLVNSVDDTLIASASNAAHEQGGGLVLAQNNGVYVQVVAAFDDTPIFSTATLPVTAATKAVAAGQARPYFTDATVRGKGELREYVVPVRNLSITEAGAAPIFLNNGALQVAAPLAGVNQQLGHLGLALLLVAIAGVALAILLGWLVARAAIEPLDDLTASVEELAHTTDVSERLEPGGPDELGRLRRAFNRLLGALETSRESQRQLVLDASHELRTPLTSLRTNLEVVRRVDELGAEDREVLVGDVLTQMEELTNLVGDLAELARGTHTEPEPGPIRLDELVEDAVGLATSHGRPRGVHFEAALEPTWVQGRRERITRAVGNLLDNALKWSPDGGTVEVACRAGTVSVRDHGPGIAPFDLPRVFDRFYRAGSARALPGSGLGLAIVAQVAHDEGGTVAASTPPDGGTLMELRLPVVRAPAEVPAPD
ncbi:MAG TPA: HAMP domain-containing sensor histidine kinase [Acidimicrobiales bacterium]|nr:HAMP domain-containing sensor histidine kinase [Acidimicrobiales bacterium]